MMRRITQLILGEADESPITQEVAEWIDLRVASAAGIREAAHGLDPLYRALAVAYFGSARVNELESAHPEQVCREGLEWLANTARSRGAQGFLPLGHDQQIAVLDSMSNSRNNPGARLFTLLKTEIVKGYYTSQTGLKELDFKGNAFYARSPGCDSRKGQIQTT